MHVAVHESEDFFLLPEICYEKLWTRASAPAQQQPSRNSNVEEKM